MNPTSGQHQTTPENNQIVTYTVYPSQDDTHFHNTLLLLNENIVTLSLCGRQEITPQGFINAPFPRSVRAIDLSGTRITDAGLHNIFARCPLLEQLCVNACKAITIAGFSTTRLPLNLSRIYFQQTRINTIDIHNIFYTMRNAYTLWVQERQVEQQMVNSYFNRPLSSQLNAQQQALRQLRQ